MIPWGTFWLTLKRLVPCHCLDECTTDKEFFLLLLKQTSNKDLCFLKTNSCVIVEMFSKINVHCSLPHYLEGEHFQETNVYFTRLKPFKNDLAEKTALINEQCSGGCWHILNWRTY